MWINFGNLSAGKDPNLVRCKLSDPGTRTKSQCCSANCVELYQLLSNNMLQVGAQQNYSIWASTHLWLLGSQASLKPRNRHKKPSRRSNKWWIGICSARWGRHYPNWHPTWEQVASMAPQKREVMKWVGWKMMKVSHHIMPFTDGDGSKLWHWFRTTNLIAFSIKILHFGVSTILEPCNNLRSFFLIFLPSMVQRHPPGKTPCTSPVSRIVNRPPEFVFHSLPTHSHFLPATHPHKASRTLWVLHIGKDVRCTIAT